MTMHLTDQDFQAALTQHDTVLVDFYADWCGPCRILAPTIEELAKEYEGRALVAKVDIDQNPDSAQRLGVMAVPTVVVFRNGKEVARYVGAQPKGVLKKALESSSP